MTQANNLQLSLNPTTQVDPEFLEPFVTLENIEEPESYKYIKLVEIYRMWRRIRDGIPASGYRPNNCPIGFDGDFIRIWLDFYVMPSTPDLEFSLNTTIGEISDPKIIDLPRELDILFGLTDHYDLNFYPTSSSLFWQTGCWDINCESVAPPPLTQIDYRISIGRDLFGVARFGGTAYCEERRLNIVLEKGDNAISGFQPVVTASWRNLKGGLETKQLDIYVPDCVRYALELCEGEGGDTYCKGGDPAPISLYVSACDGSLLDSRPGEDTEGWCYGEDV